jgi:hypothetical protein
LAGSGGATFHAACGAELTAEELALTALAFKALCGALLTDAPLADPLLAGAVVAGAPSTGIAETGAGLAAAIDAGALFAGIGFIGTAFTGVQFAEELGDAIVAMFIGALEGASLLRAGTFAGRCAGARVAVEAGGGAGGAGGTCSLAGAGSNDRGAPGAASKRSGLKLEYRIGGTTVHSPLCGAFATGAIGAGGA